LFRLSALHMAGVAAPVAAYLLFYLHQGGRLSAFLYWNVLFNLESNYAVLGRLLPRYYDVILMTPAFILLPPFLLTLRPSFHDDPRSQSRLLLLLLLLAALVYQYPRYSGGHWPIALPLIAALSGLVCNDLLQIEGPRRLFRGVFLAFVLLWLLQGVASYWPYWSGQASQEIARVDELKQLAIEVDAHLAPDDTLAIVPNNEAVDNLYYLLQRRPPRYWVMHYRWFANERTISRSIAALEEERPETILYFEQHAGMLDAWTELAAYVREKYEKEAQIMWDGYPLHIMRRRTTQ
ncbi:MAG: hypothetical protein R3272_17405, partial [Candidatus Promineifilaceae bacterium]|nr:hypothetical protein [Candidatus Promineifilaceae bacterium]